jgi:hypothetical protein
LRGIIVVVNNSNNFISGRSTRQWSRHEIGNGGTAAGLWIIVSEIDYRSIALPDVSERAGRRWWWHWSPRKGRNLRHPVQDGTHKVSTAEWTTHETSKPNAVIFIIAIHHGFIAAACTTHTARFEAIIVRVDAGNCIVAAVVVVVYVDWALRVSARSWARSSHQPKWQSNKMKQRKCPSTSATSRTHRAIDQLKHIR